MFFSLLKNEDEGEKSQRILPDVNQCRCWFVTHAIKVRFSNSISAIMHSLHILYCPTQPQRFHFCEVIDGVFGREPAFQVFHRVYRQIHPSIGNVHSKPQGLPPRIALKSRADSRVHSATDDDDDDDDDDYWSNGIIHLVSCHLWGLLRCDNVPKARIHLCWTMVISLRPKVLRVILTHEWQGNSIIENNQHLLSK